jgi:hypothetical protein
MTATLIWCGSEDIDFLTGSNAPTVSTTSGYFNPISARCAVRNTTLGEYIQSDLFAEQTTLGLKVDVYLHAAGPSGFAGGTRFVGLGKSGAAERGLFLVNKDNGQASRLSLCKYDGSTMTELAYTTGYILAAETKYRYDIYVEDYGATATVTVRMDETEVLTFSGDISVTGVTGYDCVQSTIGWAFYGFWEIHPYISSVIVADSATDMLLLATHALSAGDANNWDGSHTDINEVTNNESTVLYTDTADEDAQFALTNSPVGYFNVIACRIVARAKKSEDAAIGTLKLGVKSGGSVYVDAGNSLTTSFANYSSIITTINSAAIDVATIDAMQLDLQSET